MIFDKISNNKRSRLQNNPKSTLETPAPQCTSTPPHLNPFSILSQTQSKYCIIFSVLASCNKYTQWRIEESYLSQRPAAAVMTGLADWGTHSDVLLAQPVDVLGCCAVAEPQAVFWFWGQDLVCVAVLQAHFYLFYYYLSANIYIIFIQSNTHGTSSLSTSSISQFPQLSADPHPIILTPKYNYHPQNIQHFDKLSISPVPQMEVHSTRYHSQQLNSLVSQLNSQAEILKKMKIKNLQDDRKAHRSCIQINKNTLQTRNPFNNKTKQHTLFTTNPPQIPYLFIPKYKNETFIMPDRIFERGQAGKRFHIKMKDSSVFSFKDPENGKMTEFLHRREKDRVISGRKMEELNRILDQNDGREREKKFTKHLKTRKIFNPTRTNFDVFSEVSPMLEPKDLQILQMKKTNLAKTFGPNMWRPASRANSFNRTMNCSLSKTTDLLSSVSQR